MPFVCRNPRIRSSRAPGVCTLPIPLFHCTLVAVNAPESSDALQLRAKRWSILLENVKNNSWTPKTRPNLVVADVIAVALAENDRDQGEAAVEMSLTNAPTDA